MHLIVVWKKIKINFILLNHVFSKIIVIVSSFNTFHARKKWLNFLLKNEIVEKHLNVIDFFVDEIEIDFIDFVFIDFDDFDVIDQKFLIRNVNRKCDIFTNEIENECRIRWNIVLLRRKSNLITFWSKRSLILLTILIFLLLIFLLLIFNLRLLLIFLLLIFK